MKRLLSLVAASLLSAASGAAEEAQFLVLGKDGEMVAGPLTSKGLPDRLQAGQTLAWTKLQESWYEDFHEILACRSAGEWNLTGAAEEFVRTASGVNKAAFRVRGLPVKAGLLLLLEKGEADSLKPTGIFRCFLATDPSGWFDTLPRGDYLMVAFGNDGYGGGQRGDREQAYVRL